MEKKKDLWAKNGYEWVFDINCWDFIRNRGSGQDELSKKGRGGGRVGR